MNLQKTLGIYFSSPDPEGYPFHTAWYLKSYTDLIERIEKNNIRVVIVRNDAYLGNKKWARYSKIEQGVVVPYEEEIIVDLVFNRDDANTIPRIDDCPVINTMEFDELCIDKYKTAQLLQEYCPKTAYIHTFEQLQTTLKSWHLEPHQKIVLKKNFLHSGLGIFITEWENVEEDMYSEWTNIVLQIFEDSSSGIPGLTGTTHDFRVHMVGGEPTHGLLRTPKDGVLIATIELGGTGKTIDKKDIDPKLVEIAQNIHQKLKQYGGDLYGADFLLNTQGQYKLLELNSRPGVPNPDWTQYELIQQSFVDLLVDATQKLK